MLDSKVTVAGAKCFLSANGRRNPRPGFEAYLMTRREGGYTVAYWLENVGGTMRIYRRQHISFCGCNTCQNGVTDTATN